MKFKVGDAVVHWVYGLGEIIRLEERSISGKQGLYYAVKIQNMTVWVPVDEKTGRRLRLPTPKPEFSKLITILKGPGRSLPDDRFERKAKLQGILKEGKAESLCTVIRALSSYQRKKTLNDNDKDILKRASDVLTGEWGYAMSIPQAQAASELHHLLGLV